MQHLIIPEVFTDSLKIVKTKDTNALRETSPKNVGTRRKNLPFKQRHEISRSNTLRKSAKRVLKSSQTRPNANLESSRQINVSFCTCL